jgi:hypothetical protein
MAQGRVRRTDHRNNYVPTDYNDLYRYYIEGPGSLCSQLIRSKMPHATEDELRELPQQVALRCVEKDVIKIFDPAQANFGGVIYFVTRTIVVNHLDRKGRNPLTGLNGGSLATSEPEDDDFEPGAYSLTRLFPTPAPNHEAQLDARALLEELLAKCKALYDKPRHKRDESLYPLLLLLAEEQDPKEMAPQLGVSTSTISNWLAVLKTMANDIAKSIGYEPSFR